MTVKNSSGGAQNDGSGATGDQNQNQNQNSNGDGGAGDGGKKLVSEDDHNRALEDLHKFKKQAKESLERTQKLEADLEKLKKDGLKSTNDYKTLFEQAEQEKETLKGENKKLKDGFMDHLKRSELRAKAVEKGIKKEALDDLSLVDTSEIETEFTSSGRYLINGVDGFVERLKKTKQHWFASNNPANINTGGKGGGGEGKPLTHSYMLELERTDPKKYKELAPQYFKQQSASKK